MQFVKTVKVEMYQTKDGENFPTKKEADKHAIKLEFMEILESIWYRDIAMEDVLDGLLESKHPLMQLIKQDMEKYSCASKKI